MKKNRKRIAMVLTPGFLYRFFNRFLRKMYLGILTGMVVILTQPGFTAEINLKTAETIARNFITYLGEDYTIGKTEPVEKSGQMVGYLTNLTPHGYILVAGNTIRIPIKAYSLSSNFDNLPPGYVQTLLNELQIQAPLSSRSTFAYTPSTTPPEETNHAYWDFLGGNPVVLRKTYTYTPDTRLVTTTWNQGYPYNKFTPKLGGESTLTGCTQTALAQVMRYHGHPSSGSGVFNHAWEGVTLTAVMNRPFNWTAMPDSLAGSVAPYQQEEVAALMRDLGILNQADYGTDATSAWFNSDEFERAFGYAPVKSMDSIKDDFFATIVNEIDNRRPLLLVMPNHMVVADGYASGGNGKSIHLNLGWGGASDDYYYLDQTNVIGNYSFPPNHTIYYNIQPCQGSECYPYTPVGEGEPPVIASNLDDSILTTSGILRIEAYDPDGDNVRLSAKSSCNSLQVSLIRNLLTVTPGGNNIFCEVTIGAVSPDGNANKTFKVLALDNMVHIGTQYDINGEFADGNQTDEYTAYFDGQTTISGNNGYSRQGFYIWVKDNSGNIVVPASDTQISNNFIPGLYRVYASLKNPFTNYYYIYDADFSGYNLMVTCKDLTYGVSDLADSLGINLSEEDTDSTKFNQTQVSQLYVSIFGRASEGEGNAYWRSTQDKMVTAANIMLGSPAAKSYFGATLNDDQMFIEFIYENTLGKTYGEDPHGVNYWVGRLGAGTSKGQVVASMINAVMDPQFIGLPSQDRFINKVAICNYTADTIAKCPDINDLLPFVGFVSSVTDDPATVADAKIAVDVFGSEN